LADTRRTNNTINLANGAGECRGFGEVALDGN